MQIMEFYPNAGSAGRINALQTVKCSDDMVMGIIDKLEFKIECYYKSKHNNHITEATFSEVRNSADDSI